MSDIRRNTSGIVCRTKLLPSASRFSPPISLIHQASTPVAALSLKLKLEESLECMRVP